jgi:phenylpropionate dioxygenase-like ring-hydroxylating dioxygenase large terminal subunit
MKNEAAERSADGSGSFDLLPEVGFHNYWYPVIESRQLNTRPVSIQVLGESIVLFRAREGKVAALADRCPHRGTMLSRGRILFPGTLSCGYHGWTFNAEGECVAAIVEGPESRLSGRARVKAYPTDERLGVVWVYMGEGEAPPLESDLPSVLGQPGISPHLIFWEWDCNWRYVVDNYADMCHAPYVHRSSGKFLFIKVPAWAKMSVEPMPDGKGFYVASVGGGMEANFPGLGKFPASQWWRVISRKQKNRPGGFGFRAELCMPGYLILRGQMDAVMGVVMDNVGWPVPIDEHRTRYVGFLMTYPKTFLGRIGLALWWKYFKHLHLAFLNQDKRLVESQDSGSETLSSIDIGVVAWRHFAAKAARKPGIEGREDAGTSAETNGVSAIPASAGS